METSFASDLKEIDKETTIQRKIPAMANPAQMT
jgi:hypothetical protein